MIIAYNSNNTFKAEIITEENKDLLNNALWIDLLSPSKEEENLIEDWLNFTVPTREEMQEIEFSSQLYKENGILFMTVIMLEKSASSEPKNDAVTLILTENKLITVRYIEPLSFALFTSHLSKLSSENFNATALLLELLDVSIDRLADILENVSRYLDEYSQNIFRPEASGKSLAGNDYKKLLQKIGASGDLNTKVQESLTSFNRMMTFFGKKAPPHPSLDIQSILTMLAKDIKSLQDHVNFISEKVNFLLNATLGMINIEQNNIIKIFSIAAVVSLPPTLIASIYGMNFTNIPELKFHFGYPIALTLMFISAWIPYRYFKIKKWL